MDLMSPISFLVYPFKMGIEKIMSKGFSYAHKKPVR
jgi:hypothetical protein